MRVTDYKRGPLTPVQRREFSVLNVVSSFHSPGEQRFSGPPLGSLRRLVETVVSDTKVPSVGILTPRPDRRPFTGRAPDLFGIEK